MSEKNSNEVVMSAGLDVRSSPINSSGVFATRAYAAGETVHMMDGRRLSTLRCIADIATWRVRMDDPLQIDDHTYLALDDVSIRFNHSCDANAAIRGERELFALQPIAQGNEITFDYSLTVRPTFYTRQWRMPCNCRTSACRGKVGDLFTVPASKRQAAVDQGALQDYMVHWLYQSPWNWSKFRPTPAPRPPAKDHSIFISGNRTGVVLLHGLSGTPVEMGEVARDLAARGFTVSCPQLAGHCGTYEDLKVVRWHDWVASALEAVQRLRETCDTVVIGGLSTGAVLSLNIAARYPDLIQGVAVLAPTLWLNGWMVPYHAYLFNIVLQKPVANQFDFPDLPPHGIKDEVIRRRVKTAIDSGDSSIAGLAITPGGAVIEHRWLVNATRRDMKWITQPALIVHPRQDDYAHFNNVADIIQRLGGPVETITLDDSYHVVTLDRQRHVLMERLAGFVARVAVGRQPVAQSAAAGHGGKESPIRIAAAMEP
jgi:carboxylesterase